MSTDTLEEFTRANRCDRCPILDLFAKRTSLAAQIGVYKRKHNLSIPDPSRERQKIEMVEHPSLSISNHLRVLLMHVLMDGGQITAEPPLMKEIPASYGL